MHIYYAIYVHVDMEGYATILATKYCICMDVYSVSINIFGTYVHTYIYKKNYSNDCMCCLERGPPCRQDHLLHDAPRGGGRGGQGQGLYPPRLRNKVGSGTVNKVGSRLSTGNKVGSRLSTVNKVGSRSRTLSPMLQEQGRMKVKDSIPHASGTR